MSMKMSMILPEDSLFREDCLKVLELLYEKFKTEVENNEPIDVALRKFSIENGSAGKNDTGSEIWLTQRELQRYDVSPEICQKVLAYFDKKIIEVTDNIYY